ncbi:hypothetical protein ABZU32_06860 [Sphaerisporangium sp. NPDC005288]|uniref:hypothetical protein n=1 Tax=Sphaerisporangium sp. NPDC005288 TaxID=3155114 RepID=UPI0033AD6526
MFSMPRKTHAISAEQARQPYGRPRPAVTRIGLLVVTVIALTVLITDVLGLPGRLGAGLVLVVLAVLAGLQADRLMHPAGARPRPNLRTHR